MWYYLVFYSFFIISSWKKFRIFVCCACDFERENEKSEIIVYLCDIILVFYSFLLLFHLDKKIRIFVFVFVILKGKIRNMKLL